MSEKFVAFQMGICFSGDQDGGKQAVGGGQRSHMTAQNNHGPNDAVDHFFRSKGQQLLFNQIEVYQSMHADAATIFLKILSVEALSLYLGFYFNFAFPFLFIFT